MRSIIDTLDLTVGEIEELCDTALDMIKRPKLYSHICDDKILATLFFEPSTRTRLSFEAAMYELGGHVLSVTDMATSSASKGESMADTSKVLSAYSDIIAMRHPKEGAAFVAAENAKVPVINAGDGGHCHPTQTLADMLTIYREKGHFDGLTVGLCGDLLYGRTVHSLIHALSRYEGVKFICISPSELRLPSYMKQDFNVEETTSLEEAIPMLDVLYMTRIQQERFADRQNYERLKDSYVLTPEKLSRAKSDCIVMHPLPRVKEISVAVDKDPRACYFKQVENGKYMRMALIYKLLTDAEENHAREVRPSVSDGKKCVNPRCIVSVEQELPHRYKKDSRGVCRCIYCDSEMV